MGCGASAPQAPQQPGESLPKSQPQSKAPQQPKKAKSQPAESPEELFKRFDRSGDGKMQQSETATALAVLLGLDSKSVIGEFGNFDADGDGTLNIAEFKALYCWAQEFAKDFPDMVNQKYGGISHARYAKLFDAFDKSGDGKMQMSEASNALTVLLGLNSKDLLTEFGSFDTNGDGTLDLEEFKALYNWAKEFARDFPDAVQPVDGNFLKAIFFSFDKSGDGKMQVQEASTALETVIGLDAKAVLGEFGNFDTDGDGTLDLQEFKALYKWAKEFAETFPDAVSEDYKGKGKQ